MPFTAMGSRSALSLIGGRANLLAKDTGLKDMDLETKGEKDK